MSTRAVRDRRSPWLFSQHEILATAQGVSCSQLAPLCSIMVPPVRSIRYTDWLAFLLATAVTSKHMSGIDGIADATAETYGKHSFPPFPGEDPSEQQFDDWSESVTTTLSKLVPRTSRWRGSERHGDGARLPFDSPLLDFRRTP